MTHRGGLDKLAHEFVQAAHESDDGPLEDVSHLTNRREI
jgi:hypothetical protein